MHGLNNPHIALTLLAARIAQLEQEVARLSADLEAFMPIQREEMLRSTLGHFERELSNAIEQQAKYTELAKGELEPQSADEALLDKAVELATTQQSMRLIRTMARLIWIALTRVCGDQRSSSTTYSVSVAGLGNMRLTFNQRGASVLAMHTGVTVPISTKCGPVELDRIPGGWMASLYGEGYSPREVIHADTYAQLSAEIATQWM
jgi:hypothetical protein